MPIVGRINRRDNLRSKSTSTMAKSQKKSSSELTTAKLPADVGLQSLNKKSYSKKFLLHAELSKESKNAIGNVFVALEDIMFENDGNEGTFLSSKLKNDVALSHKRKKSNQRYLKDTEVVNFQKDFDVFNLCNVTIERQSKNLEVSAIKSKPKMINKKQKMDVADGSQKTRTLKIFTSNNTIDDDGHCIEITNKNRKVSPVKVSSPEKFITNSSLRSKTIATNKSRLQESKNDKMSLVIDKKKERSKKRSNEVDIETTFVVEADEPLKSRKNQAAIHETSSDKRNNIKSTSSPSKMLETEKSVAAKRGKPKIIDVSHKNEDIAVSCSKGKKDISRSKVASEILQSDTTKEILKSNETCGNLVIISTKHRKESDLKSPVKDSRSIKDKILKKKLTTNEKEGNSIHLETQINSREKQLPQKPVKKLQNELSDGIVEVRKRKSIFESLERPTTIENAIKDNISKNDGLIESSVTESTSTANIHNSTARKRKSALGMKDEKNSTMKQMNEEGTDHSGRRKRSPPLKMNVKEDVTYSIQSSSSNTPAANVAGDESNLQKRKRKSALDGTNRSVIDEKCVVKIDDMNVISNLNLSKNKPALPLINFTKTPDIMKRKSALFTDKMVTSTNEQTFEDKSTKVVPESSKNVSRTMIEEVHSGKSVLSAPKNAESLFASEEKYAPHIQSRRSLASVRSTVRHDSPLITGNHRSMATDLQATTSSLARSSPYKRPLSTLSDIADFGGTNENEPKEKMARIEESFLTPSGHQNVSFSNRVQVKQIKGNSFNSETGTGDSSEKDVADMVELERQVKESIEHTKRELLKKRLAASERGVPGTSATAVSRYGLRKRQELSQAAIDKESDVTKVTTFNFANPNSNSAVGDLRSKIGSRKRRMEERAGMKVNDKMNDKDKEVGEISDVMEKNEGVDTSDDKKKSEDSLTSDVSEDGTDVQDDIKRSRCTMI